MSTLFISLSNDELAANCTAGTYKRQWRDKSGGPTESFLQLTLGVDRYHRFPASLSSIGTKEMSQYDYDVYWASRFLHMRTWGSPLTSCTTTTDLLMTVYDAILGWFYFIVLITYAVYHLHSALAFVQGVWNPSSGHQLGQCIVQTSTLSEC